jgi:hypothetical protein
LVIRTFALSPECGCNLGLHETLRYVLSREERVSLWGPYRIDAGLYRRALQQAALLQSGRVLYKANDRGYCCDDVSNCVHAVSSLADGYGRQFGILAWGEAASSGVLDELAPWVLDHGREYPWVACALGLERYPITNRSWNPPRRGILRGSLDWLLGREDSLTATYGAAVC